jgi:nitrous oxidase accessory protein NosD
MSSSEELAALETVELESLTEELERSGAGAAEPGAVGRTLFVSARASGQGNGSERSPFTRISDAVKEARPGDTIQVRAGTYRERIVLSKASNVQAGTPEKSIKLLGEVNGVKPKLLIPKPTSDDPTEPSEALVKVALSHWHIEGFELDVGGVRAFAVEFRDNAQGCSLLRCDVHDGKHGAGVSTSKGASGIVIEGNIIHDFQHVLKGQDSHGVMVQPTSQDITIRDNHISKTSGDAVQVIFDIKAHKGMKPAEGVLIEDNRLESTRENGVDIKTSNHVIVRRNKIRDFRGTDTAPGGDGVVVHYSAHDVRIENNDIFEAGRGISVGGSKDEGMPDPSEVVVRNNHIHDLFLERAKDKKDAVGIRVNNARNVKILDNLIEKTDSFALRLGGEGDGGSDDVTVMGNTMLSSQLIRLGSDAPGFKSDSNRYSRRGRFQFKGDKNLDLDEWRKRTGQDAKSVLVEPDGKPS